MSVHYSTEYQTAVGTTGEISHARWRRHVEVISRYKDGGSVLDIGCSSGGFLGSLKAGSWKLHGIELSPLTAERARAKTGADIFVGEALDANFPPRSFDLITCMDVLEHLYEPSEVLKRVSEWLKPGGIFYVFVPNIRSWEARIFRSYWYGLDLPRHLHHFSAKSLGTLAASAGLQQLQMVTPVGDYLEENTRLLFDGMARKARLRSEPLNWFVQPSIPERILRKGCRLTVNALFGLTASSFNAAASIRAVFGKAAEFDSERGSGPELQSANQPR
jgi:SAM-dependent methyltransferase